MSRVILYALALSVLGATQHQPAPNDNPAVTIAVDATLNRHAIDPRIYGVAWVDTANWPNNDLGITINRWGGNAMSRYNWAYSTANRCKDYFFENQPDTVSSGDGSNGKSADDFIQPTLAAGAQPIMTIPMMGLLPKDRVVRCGYSVVKYGAQDAQDGDCGNGKQMGVRMKGVNDPADTSAGYDSTHQANWIQHLLDTFGPASTTGVKYYALDNEPVLWSFDHWDIHPNGSTYDEVWGKMQDYGAAIKAKDPAAITTGIEEWGWSGYFDSGVDAENGDDADRQAHGNVPYAEWLLQQAHAYEMAHGTRIVDFATVHFYPQSGEFSDDTSANTQLLRNRSTRSLWDPNYQDESWIGGTQPDNGHVRLIPRLKEWVTNDYPGTHIGITEYNWGAENHINGATAQAEILGIFGREGLELGVRWTAPGLNSLAASAFKMYRNYDMAHSRFGDLSVGDVVPDATVDDLSSFAALRSADGALTIMVIEKGTASTPVTINIANYLPSGAAKWYQLDSGNVIAQQADVPVAASSLMFTAPAQTINLFVIPGSYLNPPASVSATSSNGAVTVTWPATAGAASYKVYRSTSINGPFNFIGNAPGTTFGPDGGLAADTTYLYKVASVSGSAVSPMSVLDAATTTIFDDDPLAAGVIAQAVHITQLRTAVNAMRTAAALGPQMFADSPLTVGTPIRALHVMQLRTALDQARATLGLPAMIYTDPTLTIGVTTLKAAHMTDLRNGVK
jgi:hypothetical protein